jgi:hypothetical protein
MICRKLLCINALRDTSSSAWQSSRGTDEGFNSRFFCGEIQRFLFVDSSDVGYYKVGDNWLIAGRRRQRVTHSHSKA